MPTIILPDYVPRPWQQKFDYEFYNSGKSRAFLVWARRHGKDIACWNHLVFRAAQKTGIYYYLYPRQNQARKAIWEAMTETGKKFLDYIPRELLAGPPNNTEMKVTLTNGSIIRILGSNNHDAFRSTNPIGVVFSEFAWHDEQTWPMIVQPILNANRGWAIFNTTPYGKNHAYHLFNYAKNTSENWYTSLVSNHESCLFTEQQLDEVRASGVSEETIQQEYYCSFDRGVDGAYYAGIVNQLKLDGKIRDVPADNYAEVHTAWDIGYGDSTVIWFYQLCGNEIHVIDYYENNTKGVDHYAQVVKRKAEQGNWIYGTHFWPFDGESGEFSTGIPRVVYAEQLGLKTFPLAREPRKDYGIERVRRWLPKCYFDAKRCEKGIRCLESYRKERDEKHGCYKETPLHDWSSHAADAFRYMCQAIETKQTASKVGLDEYRELKMKFGVGSSRNNNSILGN